MAIRQHIGQQIDDAADDKPNESIQNNQGYTRLFEEVDKDDKPTCLPIALATQRIRLRSGQANHSILCVPCFDKSPLPD